MAKGNSSDNGSLQTVPSYKELSSYNESGIRFLIFTRYFHRLKLGRAGANAIKLLSP